MRGGAQKTNYLFLFLVLVLLVFGLNILFASTSFSARLEFGDPFFFIRKQLLYASVGVALLVILSYFPISFWERSAWGIYVAAAILLLLVFIPGLGYKAGGAWRWIRFGGFSMQPSDIARFAIVLVVARVYAGEKSDRWSHHLIALMAVMLPVLLIYKEPDLGTAVHTLLFSGLLLIVAGFPFLILFLAGIVAVPTVLFSLSEYQWERISAFLDPGAHRWDSAYQLIASYKSFLAGGLLGQGLGEGLRRHNLQARHTDFILAVISEDTGWVGITFVLLLYLSLIVIALRTLPGVADPFARYAGTGIILLFSTQALMNIAVTMGLMPTTGINLPLVSYGGTSLVLYLSMFGVLLGILRLAGQRG